MFEPFDNRITPESGPTSSRSGPLGGPALSRVVARTPLGASDSPGRLSHPLGEGAEQTVWQLLFAAASAARKQGEVRTRMAYYFRVLRDLLGLTVPPGCLRR